MFSPQEEGLVCLLHEVEGPGHISEGGGVGDSSKNGVGIGAQGEALALSLQAHSHLGHIAVWHCLRAVNGHQKFGSSPYSATLCQRV